MQKKFYQSIHEFENLIEKEKFLFKVSLVDPNINREYEI